MRLSDFSDGLYLPEGADFAVPPNALLTADNVEYIISGGIKGRRGRLKLNSVALSPVISLWRHYPRTGTPSTLVAEDTGAAVDFQNASGSSGTFAAVAGGSGFATGFPWYFTNWASQNKTFLANGSDALKSYDGTTIATVTSAGGTGNLSPVPNGPYLVMHKARLWATLPAEINFSIYASAVNDPTTFPAANQISLNDPFGGKITGIQSFFDFLIGLKSTSLWRFVGDIGTLTGAQLARYSDVGCTAPNSIARTPYGILYVGKSGLFLTDGISPKPIEISTPIRSLWNTRSGATPFPNAVGGWYSTRGKEQYYLKLDPTAADGWVVQRIEVLSSNVFTGERSRAVWVWSHIPTMPVNAGTTINSWASDADDGRLVAGDSAGFIRTYDTGNMDDGVAIASTVQTTSKPLDGSGRTGRVDNVTVLHRASVALSVALRYDQHSSDDVTFSVGSAAAVTERWPRNRVTNNYSKFGRFVSISVTNPSDSYDFELHLIDLDIRFRSSRVWRDVNV